MQIYDLYKAGKLKEAEAAQLELAKAEWGFGKGGINGTKWVVAQLLGYPEGSWHCRRPYPKFGDKGMQDWVLGVVGPLMETEKLLGGRAS